MTPELLATHQIIALFEKSKGLADQIFDDLSGVFFHFDVEGNILRSNKVLAQILDIEHEDVLSASVKKIFADFTGFEAQWQIYKASPTKAIEFEMPLQTHNGEVRDYLWQLSALETGTGSRRGPIYTCVGRDISEVKIALAKVVSLAKDLELAEAVQNLLLPSEREFQNDRISLAAYYKSAAISGGDYWFYDVVSENKIWVLVGDVTGHGAGAAMVTALVSGCIHTMRMSARDTKTTPDMQALIGIVNRNLMRIKDQPYWMTLVGIEIDLSTDTITWWGAAAPPIFLLLADGTVEIFTKPSPPLGASDSAVVSEKFSFPKGARLFVPTDGVMERSNPAGTQLGPRRVNKILTSSREMTVEQTRDYIVDQMAEWSAGTLPDDDITFVIVDSKK